MESAHRASDDPPSDKFEWQPGPRDHRDSPHPLVIQHDTLEQPPRGSHDKQRVKDPCSQSSAQRVDQVTGMTSQVARDPRENRFERLPPIPRRRSTALILLVKIANQRLAAWAGDKTKQQPVREAGWTR